MDGSHDQVCDKANLADKTRFPRLSERMPWRRLLRFAIRRYRRELTSEWMKRHGNRVLAGPFTGLQLEQMASWGDGEILAKLLGTYEAELHPIVSEVCERGYSKIINVGCAEGFYAVGFGRAMPSTQVVAFDTSARAREICGTTARQNGVSERITIRGKCTTKELRELTSESCRMFLLVDCEGGELELLLPREVPGLSRADMLIECHEFLHPGVTEVLCERFAATHTIKHIEETGRPLNSFPALKELSAIDRAIVTCEWRPTMMNWLYCTSRAA